MKIFFFLTVFIGQLINAKSPDWSGQAQVPIGANRANIYLLSNDDFHRAKINGYMTATQYPVQVTGLALPYGPIKNFFDLDYQNPLKKLLASLGHRFVDFQSEKELFSWLGLNPFNQVEDQYSKYYTPRPKGSDPNMPMGAGFVNTKHGQGLTFSCFTCHSNYLFGKTVIGLTNKRSRANEFFVLGKKVAAILNPTIFQTTTEANDFETELFKYDKNNLKRVGAKNPQTLGLDTSLAQVALSLSLRRDDEFATPSLFKEKFPDQNPLEQIAADSKPMPWWNLKYKTKWLADGSIVTGNPVLTNFLWNEIGRGTDLKQLKQWMILNEKTITDLTAAVFATEAPRWTEFFSESTIQVERAKKGERIFNQSCSKCHGTYAKAWSLPDSDQMTITKQIETIEFKYFEVTPIRNVGTDPLRYEGMKYFAERLNNLEISRWMKTKVLPQEGYVPPPLIGIWSRYPYLHNNSIPNLCALMTHPEKRPRYFVQGPSVNPETDFDFDCVGYPVGEKIPKEWHQDNEAIYHVGRQGMNNHGHYRMFQTEDGEELYSNEDKRNLREFLKTL